VLVVCPASLKAEWEEQIARFTERSVRSVFGSRAARLAAYREPAFFNIVNYEQVLGDAPDINEVLRPDVIILDEAQRIKNWQIKTARQVKSLRSLYAFVLTGTPVENCIDELYSIVQYLDPELIGPLFRFNRDFYDLDARGRPVDYKSLAGLRRRLQPVMLRRRKCDVEAELPGRTVKNYFVPMAEEQALRYADYKRQAATLLAQVKRRPLTPKEFERLQMLLACMHDLRYAGDPRSKLPRQPEARGAGGRSERPAWRAGTQDHRVFRMGADAGTGAGTGRRAGRGCGLAHRLGTAAAPPCRNPSLQTGPGCRLFLSTDSGSLGLNLQVASAVVNVDLPWNPAKLEQRIARAWRKNQTRSVTVVNWSVRTRSSTRSCIFSVASRRWPMVCLTAKAISVRSKCRPAARP
jgi:SNF2 family DNA or RNA helicase